MYKVCWPKGYSDINLLVAMDDAIDDGVDVLSISIGGASNGFFDNSFAIGSFHAMKKGIFVACSAGNSGPDLYTVQNTTPWIMTAAIANLGYGAGQIDPVSALHPGLIYDLSKFDYIRFLCEEGYSGTTLRLFTKDNTDCASVPDIGGDDSLNYPSMYYQFQNPNTSINVVFHRTITNVGLKNSIYKATVKALRNLKVSIILNVLAFS
ncbi:subtilisin-like protease SBT4.15 [Quercus robur]|uniref:subtilisin-like protease SBT4.15 n=1 Tax=Quercus robur TaxID=38942 RepID=UPI002163E4A2|nr:subtilisin-like protease SBT4.15 [Quercus robur]